MQFWVHILSFPFFFFPFFFSLSLCKLYFKLPFLVRILVILQHSASSIYTKQCLTLINYSCISSPCKTCCLHWEHNFFHQVSLSFCLYLSFQNSSTAAIKCTCDFYRLQILQSTEGPSAENITSTSYHIVSWCFTCWVSPEDSRQRKGQIWNINVLVWYLYFLTM